jgi:hypothetical protein
MLTGASSATRTVRIVALAGRRRAGKDTVAAQLAAEHGFAVLKFAAPLKAALRELFGFSDAQLEEGELKEKVDERWGRSPREVMQWFGTAVLQDALPDLLPGIGRRFLVTRLLAEMDQLVESGVPGVVIADVRFPHEVEAVRAFGGRVLRVTRTSGQGGQCEAGVDAHVSEAGVDALVCDREIVNDGSLEELAAAVRAAVAESA